MTDLGKLLVEFPIDPQLGKMMLMGMTLKCLEPSVIIACCSAYKDPCKIFFLLILDIFMRKCSVEIGSIYSRIKPLLLNFHKTGIQTFKVLQHIPLIGTSLSLDKFLFIFTANFYWILTLAAVSKNTVTTELLTESNLHLKTSLK